MEIIFPHDIFLLGNILPHNPLPQPNFYLNPPPPENVCTRPNNHYYM